MRAVLLATCCCWSSCSDASVPQTPDQVTQGRPAVLQAVEHDFGIIPHPEHREHEFVLDVSVLGTPCVPLRVQLDCSCGRADMRLRHRDGTERPIDGSPNPANAVGKDEVLVVRVVIDTVTKEATDLPMTLSRGHVILQPVTDQMGNQRVLWPMLLRFGIDAPVVVRPFATLDFERVPTCTTPELVTTLEGDEAHKDMKFLSVVSSDPAIQCALEPTGAHTLLRTRCTPGELGHYRALVSVETDSPSGYRVNFATTWKVVPELEASPMPKVSFRADLRREQRPDEARGQFVLVTDHDARRPAEFVVQEVVDADGRDAKADFAVTLEPIPGQPRQHRMLVRYLGGHPDGFRGHVVLGKGAAAGPSLPIELAVFQSRDR